MALTKPMEEAVIAPPTRPPKRLFTREEYHRAAELGLFRPDERLELIEGEVMQKVSPQSRPHAMSIEAAAEALGKAFGAGYHVQQEKPISVPGANEPEPDIVVLRGSWRDYTQHPKHTDAVLVLEVADTSLAYDQRQKADYYAQAGILDYWVLNLHRRVLEVRRDPALIGDQYEYRTLLILTPGMEVSPLAMPQAVIRVDDLLPPAESEESEETK